MSGGGGLTWGVNPINHGGNQHLIDFSIVPNLGSEKGRINSGVLINPGLTLYMYIYVYIYIYMCIYIYVYIYILSLYGFLCKMAIVGCLDAFAEVLGVQHDRASPEKCKHVCFL